MSCLHSLSVHTDVMKSTGFSAPEITFNFTFQNDNKTITGPNQIQYDIKTPNILCE